MSSFRESAQQSESRSAALADQLKSLQGEKGEILFQLKAAETSLKEATDGFQRQNAQLKEEMAKMDFQLKDSKKNSSVQIMELSAQLKSMYEVRILYSLCYHFPVFILHRWLSVAKRNWKSASDCVSYRLRTSDVATQSWRRSGQTTNRVTSSTRRTNSSL